MVSECCAWIYRGDEAGLGVSEESVSCLGQQLRKNIPGIAITEMRAPAFTKALHEACSITAEEQLQKTIVVFPGGIPSMWDTQLGASVKKIREFVARGGRALMVCAGAYFSAAHSEYRQVDGPPIIKNRDLKLFPGQAIGPVVTNRHPTTNMQLGSIVTVTNLCNREELNAYFIGGGHFVPDAVEGAIDILARYKDGRIAAVSRKIGNGIAVMSFVHFEFDSINVPSINSSDLFFTYYLQSINKDLAKTFKERERFTASLIQNLKMFKSAVLLEVPLARDHV